MKKLIILLTLLLLCFGLNAESLSNESFKLKLNKAGLSTFYFTPSEIIEFVSSADQTTVAYADVSIFWEIYIDNGFTLSLEARSSNENSEADSYCLLRSDGLIGLNYLMKTENVTKGSEDNQTPLSKEERTITIVENQGSATVPVKGDIDVQLVIPYPTTEENVPVNGVYQGYLILTLTYN